jgi:hypothetical protein
MRRWGYAAEYCESYSVIRAQCDENIPGTSHFAVASLDDVKAAIQLFGTRYQSLEGLWFHTHGNQGYVHLPNGSIRTNNVGELRGVCSRFLAHGATVVFAGCNVGEGTAGADFLMAAGPAMLGHGGGTIYTSDSVTFSVPGLGQRRPVWSSIVTAVVEPGGTVIVYQ